MRTGGAPQTSAELFGIFMVLTIILDWDGLYRRDGRIIQLAARALPLVSTVPSFKEGCTFSNLFHEKGKQKHFTHLR